MKIKSLKLLLILSTIMLLSLSAPLMGVELFEMKADATTENISGYFTYTVENGEATITDFDDSYSGSLDIPSTLGGYPVTGIDAFALSNCPYLTSVTIPYSVTNIHSLAFAYISQMTDIYVSSDNYMYTSVDGVLFDEDMTTIVRYPSGKSETSYQIPNTVTTIDLASFYGCCYLESVIIPSSVTTIGHSAFQDSTSLTSISISEGTEQIGFQAFCGCTSLANISLPDSLTYIGEGAFRITAYYNDSSNWEHNNGVLYIGNHLIAVKTSVSGEYTVKAGTKCLGDYSFANCTRITSVTIPDSVVSICDRGFTNSGITSIDIPESVTWIGSDAFYNCSDLTDITIRNGNCEIYDSADTISEGAKIICLSDSTAQSYAEKYDRTFESQSHFHSYSSWETTKKATCTKKGTKERTCETCGDTQTKSIAELGHNYSSKWTTDKKATCTEKGSKSHHCTRCSAKSDVTTIKATGHSYDSWKTTKKATCTKEGTKKRTCETCGKTQTKSIDVLGHNYKTTTVKATTSKNGSVTTQCTRCSKTKSKKTIYKISSVKLSATKYSYNGKVKTPSVTVKNSNGDKLKKDTDYTVSYAKGRKNIGTYSVTVKFKGQYSGSKKLSFKISLGKVTGVKQLDKKGINFTWNQVYGADGYEVYYYDSNTKKYVKLSKTVNERLGNSNAKGSMKIKIRAYKSFDSGVYYGAYSDPITFKAKK